MSETSKGHSKFQWFFLVVCIPVIFAVILFSVILSLLGVNVLDKAKAYGSEIPVVASLLENEAVEVVEEVNVEYLNETIQKLEAEVDRLQVTLNEREEEIKKLSDEQAQIEHKAAIEEARLESEVQELKDLARTYEAMSTKNAAAIIEQLSDEDALLHLSQISIEVRAGILAKMDSELAANLITQLANQ
ncbi:MotE family protein [Halalkalibacter krulwichiae]|uniref:MgtE intracellular N domain protein n=1 Tax=Halalkalibacter krulwichiae TaxID=199441 RepID=A0A1X9MC43_9BACI|nr:MotE family protein [Halalkalibacter krulwichiae]ARK30997.1 hypothetical protein BkAM31D_14750 [Halalkalibacter krulwichiae]